MSVSKFSPASPGPVPLDAAIISKAVARAAAQLHVQQVELAAILGLSPASVSRLAASQITLAPHTKPYEFSVLFIRLYRGLAGIFGADMADARLWLRAENLALGGTPIQLMASVQGFVNTLAYVDAARARV